MAESPPDDSGDDAGTTTATPIHIDGSLLEGGGQILRLSLALATLLRIPLELENIRANRKVPGLREQHVVGLRFLSSVCAATLTGAEIRSNHVSYVPSDLCLDCSREYVAECVQTCDATVLLVQVALPCLLFGCPSADPSTPLCVKFGGGTNVDMGPVVDEFQEVFLPLFQRLFGIDFVTATCPKRCFGRWEKDGSKGVLQLELSGNIGREGLPPLVLVDRGFPIQIHIRSLSTGKTPLSEAESLCLETKTRLVDFFGEGEELEYVCDVRHDGPDRAIGSFLQVMVFLETSSGCKFGCAMTKRRRSREGRFARAVVRRIIEDWEGGGCVDQVPFLRFCSDPFAQYHQDQFLIYMTLARGRSQLRIGREMTMHTKTAIHFCQVIAGVEFHVDVCEDGSQILSVDGISFGCT